MHAPQTSVRVRARDAAGRRKLTHYMLRAPFALEKMSYRARARHLGAPDSQGLRSRSARVL